MVITKYIRNRKGMIFKALVDVEDCTLFDSYTWSVQVNAAGNCYLMRRRKDGVFEYFHRALMQPYPNQLVDHINGNGLDNTRKNLRICTNSQNQMNKQKKPTRASTSQFKGVAWNRQKRKWQSMICINTKRICLGFFENEVEAANLYNIRALELFGPFAKLNDI